jgi:hypothetical protein
MPRAWIRGEQDLAKTMRSGWLARTAFVFSRQSSVASRPPFLPRSPVRCQYACRCATKIFYPIFFKRSPPECRREDALIIFRFLFAHANFYRKNKCASVTRRLQLSGQEFWVATGFSEETLRIHNALRPYSAIRSQQIFAGECVFRFLLEPFELWRPPTTALALSRRT